MNLPTIHRNDLAWGLGVFLALCPALAQLPDPWLWSWHDWMIALPIMAGIVIAWLRTKPEAA